jgi:hypothetical protein
MIRKAGAGFTDAMRIVSPIQASALNAGMRIDTNGFIHLAGRYATHAPLRLRKRFAVAEQMIKLVQMLCSSANTQFFMSTKPAARRAKGLAGSPDVPFRPPI